MYGTFLDMRNTDNTSDIHYLCSRENGTPSVLQSRDQMVINVKHIHKLCVIKVQSFA